ncbi:MAG: YkvA family protein [Thermomicrobium sp.]|nr:YkvA family protein [Thermomicrobium sp.]
MAVTEIVRRWRRRVAALEQEVAWLSLVVRHPRASWLVRLVVVLAVAYAASPFDLIPDFVPVLGHLDDLVVLPLLVWIAWRMIPPDVEAECRAAVGKEAGQRPRWSRMAPWLVVNVWLVVALLTLWFACRP